MFTWFFELAVLKQIIIIYLISINIVSFFYFGIDKIKANFDKRRISERTLWFLTLIGGTIGSLAGMHFFRHKTKKLSFQAVIAVIMVIQILLIFIMFYPR